MTFETVYAAQIVKTCQSALAFFAARDNKRGHAELSEALFLIQNLKTHTSTSSWAVAADSDAVVRAQRLLADFAD